MSAELRWPYSVLGVDGGADRGAVRKAYARQLKQIDQAQDPEGFQALRKAYEAALARLDRAKPAAPPKPQLASAPPMPAPEPASDIATIPRPPKTESPPQHAPVMAPSDADVLLARVTTFKDGEADITRLSKILDAPALSDPLLADAVEREIYQFLQTSISHNSNGQPCFNLRMSHGAIHRPPASGPMPNLLKKLDHTFGWQSDQVRMRARFGGYDRFLLAAMAYEPGGVKHSTKTVQKRRSWIWTALWIFLVIKAFVGLGGVLGN